jgi:hypothetical protein
MEDNRIDRVAMLLSTDWFLPHWSTVGLNFQLADRLEIQTACRPSVDQIMAGAISETKEYWRTDFSLGRIAVSYSILLKELNQRSVPGDIVTALDDFIRGCIQR